jgi:hypothetical protein
MQQQIARMLEQESAARICMDAASLLAAMAQGV